MALGRSRLFMLASRQWLRHPAPQSGNTRKAGEVWPEVEGGGGEVRKVAAASLFVGGAL